MPYTEQITERLKLLTTVHTSGFMTATSKVTATIDMSKFARIMVFCSARSTAASTTQRDAYVKIVDAAATGTMASTSILSTSVIGNTAATPHQMLLELRSEQVGKKSKAAGMGRFVRVRVGAGTHRAGVVLAVFGGEQRYGPASQPVTVVDS